MKSVIDRLNELEKHLSSLKSEKEKLESLIVHDSDINDLSQMIDSLIKNFNKLFNSATIREKKNFLSLFIEKILIDQTNDQARFLIRKIPKINNLIEDSIYTDKCSGGRIRQGRTSFEQPTHGL